MSRSIALVALIGLLLSPLAVLDSANCCGAPDCCKNGLCPMPAVRSKAPAAGDRAAEMHCHRAASTPAPATLPENKCSANAQCSRSAKVIHPAPELRGVMPVAGAFVFPEAAPAGLAVMRVAAAQGYFSPPFLPPRLTT